MNWHSAISSTISERVQNLQSQLFPISAVSPQGFLNGFLLNNIKTTQIEVNNEQAVSRRLARLKEPRDLFAVPMEQGDQQDGARWPIECQVLTDRVHHIPYTPPEPEPYYKPTGKELQPQPNGEENGTVIYNYIPLSAVNYDEDFDDTNDLYSEDSELANRFTPPLELITRYDYKESPLINPRLFGYRKPIIPPSEPVAQEPQLNQFTSINKDDDLDKMELTVASELGTNGLPVPSLEDIENVADTEPKLIFPQFSRSNVGGCKFLTSVHVSPHEENDLIFESRFESGNLAKVVKITSTYYELYLRPDMYTNRNKQWFYFRVSNTKMNQIYRFSIVNLTKSDSLYNEGMRPLMYSTHDADKNKIGWRRCGENIAYYKNDSESNGGSTSKSQTDVKEKESESEDDTGSTLTFTIEFPYENDVVYFAHSYPYTYSQLQDYLMNIQKHPTKSKFCKLRLLCRSLAGNNIYVLTITSPPINEEVPPDKINKKKAIVVSARVHPGETPASWMMKGFLDFITSDSLVAKKLRHKFVFKVIPMLNPDGVIVGNTRSSLTGKDLNRQYRTVIRETYPSIWYTKMLIRRLIEENGVLMYCDMHAHSRQHNIFIYGCENRKCPDRKLLEQVFPLMLHKNAADKFSFEHCKFKVQRNKEGTGRIVVWMLGVMNSYTMEASFGGTNIGSRAKTHFSATDYENIGRSFCETLLDYADESPNKVIEMRRQIKNMRRRERKLRRARMKRIAAEEKLKQKIMNRLVEAGSKADGPQNIPLSDYSSDNEDSFGSDSDDEELLKTSELEGTCCKQPKVPPPSPEVKPKISVKKVSKRESNENNIVGKRKYRKRRSSVRAASEKSSKINIIQNLLQDQPVDYSNSQEITDQSLMVKKPKPKLQFASIKSKRIFRSVIDLSTTEPNFQPQLRPDGTYEECGNISDGYDTVPSVYRSSIRNEIYKNNIMPRVASGSPPELMIKRVAGHNDDGDVILSSCREQELSTVIYNVSEFPSIHGNKKTTKSIRNKTINVSMSSKENSLIRKDSVEMNKINLVMRNHIWSGSCTGTTEYTRPLSWGVPRLSAKPTIDEQEELLNACSKKLYIWKETKKRSQSKKRSKIEGKSAPSSIKQLPKVRKSSIDRHRDISLLNSNRPQTSADPDNCNLLGHMITHPTEEPQKLSIINLSPAKIKKTKTANRKITSFKAAEIVATAIQPSKKIKNARAKQKTKGNSDQSPQLKKLVQRVKTKLRK